MLISILHNFKRANEKATNALLMQAKKKKKNEINEWKSISGRDDSENFSALCWGKINTKNFRCYIKYYWRQIL